MTENFFPQGSVQDNISLLLGLPDTSTLLTPEFQRVMQRVFSDPSLSTSLQYGPEQVDPEMIQFLAGKINREQDLSVQSKNLMVVAGSTHAVDMLARLYAGPAGVVLVEAPTYADALSIFKDHHIELHSIPMDEHGLIPTALETQLRQLHANGKDPAMLYTIPNFHNPTGSTLTTERRREIITLARRYGFLIVEDDVYRDLAFGVPLPPSFYALAHGAGVMSIGSFSKTLAPGLRLGWLLASEEVIQRCIACGTTQMGGGANPFVARVVSEYCRSGHWETHIAQLCSLYQERRDTMLTALSRSMPTDVTWTRPQGGFFTWLSLPPMISAQRIKQMALQEKVSLATGEGFFVNPIDGEHNLRLAYSYAKPADIDIGVSRLAAIIQQARSTT